MKKVSQIAFLLISLAFIHLQINGQNLPVVCGGSKVRYGATKVYQESTFAWTADGGTILMDYKDSVDVTWDNTPGLHRIIVSEILNTGCVAAPDTGYVFVSVPLKPELGFDLEICKGKNIRISSSIPYTNSTYSWNTGATTPSIDATIQGWYKLQVTDQYHCSVSDSVYLTVNDIPHINLGRDTILCGDVKSVLLDAGYGGTDYLWTNNINSATWNSQTIEVTDAARYFVKVTNDKNCENTSTILVGKCDVFIPNAFTPNGDNPTWVIRDLESYPYASVEIFDRWGRLVYITKNGYPSTGWDGTSRGRNLPMDSYFYFIKLNDGSNKTLKGSVTIIR